MLFGMGSEPLVVAQSAILVRWFRGKELALSFGIALTVSRLGTLFTFNSEALIARRALGSGGAVRREPGRQPRLQPPGQEGRVGLG